MQCSETWPSSCPPLDLPLKSILHAPAKRKLFKTFSFRKKNIAIGSDKLVVPGSPFRRIRNGPAVLLRRIRQIRRFPMRHTPSSLGKELLSFFAEKEIHQQGCGMR